MVCLHRNLILLVLSSLLVVPLGARAEAGRPITVKDLYSIGRVGGLVVSPYSDHAAFTVSRFDMEQNSSRTDLYVVRLSDGRVRQLTRGKGSSRGAHWLSAHTLAFVSTRSDSPQIWKMAINGGEATQISKLPMGVDDFAVSPTGEYLVVRASSHPECTDLACNARKIEEKKSDKSTGRVHEQLPIRIWSHWLDERREHLWKLPLDGQEPMELTPGNIRAAALDLGGHHDLSISPDGLEIAFVSNTTAEVAWNTNNDVLAVSAGGGPVRNLTAQNKAVDADPVYSPDGRYLAYVSMERPGFEADKRVLTLLDRQSNNVRRLTAGLDLAVMGFHFAPDSRSVVFYTYERGQKAIYTLDIASGQHARLVGQGYNSSPQFTRDGKQVVYLSQNLCAPNEIYMVPATGGAPRQLTHITREAMAPVECGAHEEFEFTGAGGDKVHGFLIKPPGFQPGKKYPLLLMIHGGPQGAFGNDFHYRWNLQMFAAPGFVVATINFHGSAGYGQKFTDAVSKDWGGKPYEDILKGVDYLESNYKYIEQGNVSAAGASYGGFMINWLLGHTDRFKSLVSHAGLFDHFSMYGATEELWFPEWEFGGTPWEKPELFKKFNPIAFAGNFKTPTLVVHGEHDYRVPYTQGLQLFTALQRQGVESKLLIFPDETHFVQKPQNARQWWNTVRAWLADHAGLKWDPK